MEADGEPNEQDWVKHKTAIWRMFIVQEMQMTDVLVELQKLGLSATKSQLVSRLKKWEFRRNINKSTWRAVDNTIKKRQLQGKDSEVIHNVKRLKAAKVNKEISRNRELPTLVSQDPIPNPPHDSSVVVCTPAPLPLEFDWPATLPWMQFQPTYLSHFENTVRPWPEAQRAGISDSSIVHLKANIGSALSSTTDKSDPPLSLSRLAAMIGVSVPECFEGEHIYRAKVFNDALSVDDTPALHECLKTVIFHASNGFPLLEEQRWEFAVDVLRQSGLMRHTRFEISLLSDITVLAFMEKLFQTAVVRVVTGKDDQGLLFGISAPDVIQWLLKCGHSPDSPVPISSAMGNILITAAQAAVMSADLGFLRVLLDGKASPDLTLSSIPRPLRLALDPMRSSSYGFRVSTSVSEDIDGQMASLLVNRGAASHEPVTYKQEPLLDLALRNGHFNIIAELLDLGASLCMKRKPKKGMIYESTILSCAAGFQPSSRQSKHTALSFVTRFVDWAKVNHQPIADLISPDVFIAAALARNLDVIRYLYSLDPENAIRRNHLGFKALHAAAKSGCVETYTFLLGLGTIRDAFCGPLSPVHIACTYDNRDILELSLGKWPYLEALASADLETYRRVFHDVHFPLHSSSHNLARDAVTILRLALVSGSTSCALALIKRGAKLKSGKEVIWATRYCRDVALLDELLSAGGDPNNSDGAGTLPLSLVLKNPQWESWQDLAGTLLRYGASVPSEHLATAILNGHSATTENLLAQRPDWALTQDSITTVKTIRPGDSVLEAAILAHDNTMVRRLLQGSDMLGWVSTTLLEPQYWCVGYKPQYLCAAVEGGWDQAFIRCLLSFRPENVSDHEVTIEMTALGLACQRSSSEDVLSLLCDALPTNSTSFLPFRYASEHGTFERVFWDKRSPIWHPRDIVVEGSPLTWAALSKNTSAFLLLLRRGHKPDWITWLSLVGNDLTELASILQQGGHRVPDIGYFERSRDRPLNSAISRRNSEMVTILLKAGAPVNHSVRYVPSGLTPLQHAVHIGDLDVINILLEAGAEINAPPAERAGATALQLASIQGFIGIGKLFLEQGADVNAPGALMSGRTALEGTAEYGRIDMIELLLKYGAETTGAFGRKQYVRSIRFAERMGHFVAAKVLKRHGGWTDEDELLQWDRGDLNFGRPVRRSEDGI